MKATDYRKWLAIGAGVGIEIGRDQLTATVVRARPSGARILGYFKISGFRDKPAGEWGAEYAGFLKKLGVGHLAATVLLPRDEVMMRPLALPGVSDKDLAAAIRFEIDSMNPYSDEESVFDWARVGKSSSILVGFTRQSVLERYQTLFAEAGVKVASFTFSAPAIYSALRLYSTPSADGFLTLAEEDDELEVYGESASRPVYSARLTGSSERARTLAVAELRLPPDTEPMPLHQALPQPGAAPGEYDFARSALSYATALSGAGLTRPISVNLLPREQRRSSSRIRLVPAIALAVLALLAAGAAVAYPKFADQRYLGRLQSEIRRVEPRARKAAELDREVAVTRNRTQTLDRFRLRTKEDLDALNELTDLLAPPAWLNALQLTRDSLSISGAAPQAAGLVKLLDSTRQFRGSAFTIPIVPGAGGEVFSLRARREGVAQ
ncbi:MAG: hypothetical protein ABSB86_05830 [Bryobacteraceae bacterium]